MSTTTTDRNHLSGTSSDRAWAQKVHEVELWVKDRGRLPSRYSADTVEKRHGTFLFTQRRAKSGTNRGQWSDTRRQVLDARIPGWDDTRFTAFSRSVDEAAEWVTKNGRLPAQSSKDPIEKRHGRFLDTQRQAKAGQVRSSWDDRRQAYLDERISNWDDPIFALFITKVDAAAHWIADHNRRPWAGSSDSTEKQHALFLLRQRQAKAGQAGQLWDARRENYLDTKIPRWAGSAAVGPSA